MSHFFSVYDSKAREAAGVFYTPVEVVEQIVSGVDFFLVSSFGRSAGVLDDDSRFLDPATGTGTFILGLARGAARAAKRLGLPADQAVSDLVTKRIAAFELLPGPYAIAHQRIEALLESYGVAATSRLPIYLTDTLAAPETGTLLSSGFGAAGDQLLEERGRADEVKTQDELLVVLGNPPYERLAAKGSQEPFSRKLMEILRAATPADKRVDLKSASDLYVAFWLWTMWVLQPPETRLDTGSDPRIDTRDAHGIMAFVSNRTWLVGRSLVGLRSLIRRGAKEIWILDLGGDLRGSDGIRDFAPADQNVFDIQTGVAISWVLFDRNFDGAPVVKYKRLLGTRKEKLAHLLREFEPDLFDVVDIERQPDIFAAAEWDNDDIASSPPLSSLFVDDPGTGFQTARDTADTSPLNVDRDDLLHVSQPTPGSVPLLGGALGQWAKLPASVRTKEWATAQSQRSGRQVPAAESITTRKLRKIMYRPLDYRWLYDDPAWVDWYREDLHKIFEHGAIPTLITKPRGQGRGPAAIHSLVLPDQHSFKGSAGGKAVWHLWHPAGHQVGKYDNADPRTIHGQFRSGFALPVLEWLDDIDESCNFEGAYSYVLATLSADKYTSRNWAALDVDQPRIPLTAEKSLFQLAVGIGDELRAAWELRAPKSDGLIWEGLPSAGTPLGKATWKNGGIAFANGRRLEGVSHDAWSYSVSGYKVLPRWFAARQHWRLTTQRAIEAMSVVSAAEALSELGLRANALLEAYPSRDNTV